MPKYQILGSDDSEARVRCALRLHSSTEGLKAIRYVLDLIRLSSHQEDIIVPSMGLLPALEMILAELDNCIEIFESDVKTLVPECDRNSPDSPP